MVERKQITLLYVFDENWIGGTYYVLNIIKALNTLEPHLMPEIKLLYNSGSSIKLIEEIKYPYISFNEAPLKLSIPQRAINLLARRFFSINVFKIKLPFDKIFNLYPCTTLINFENVIGKYYWIPDFQQNHLPHLFTKRSLKGRTQNINEMIESNIPIVFSSQNSLDDFHRFYPHGKNKVYVIPFVCILNQDYKKLHIDELCKKFNIDRQYLTSPNQFWIHKNHIVVLKALKILKERDIKTQVVFTGKEFDDRNPEYFPSLQKFVVDNDLGDYVRFLGFIDRDEQLKLMSESLAVIQPSLFEGWSTVVEDAKAVGKFVILSDIPLHKEQIQKNCKFFDPHNPVDLADKIQSQLLSTTEFESLDYDMQIKFFAKNILQIIQ